MIKRFKLIKIKKKGQIYILAALILCAVIFLLVAEVNILKREEVEDNFMELSQNYKVESAKFVNSLLSKGESIPDSFSNFTILFSAYSRAQNPNFGLIYAFNYGDFLYVGNYLDQAVVVDCDGTSCTPTFLNGCLSEVELCLTQEGNCLDMINMQVIESCKAEIPDGSINEVAITIDGIGYVFEITPNQPEIIIVSREYIGELSKVYMGGEFKEEKSGAGIFFTDIGRECSDYSRKVGCEKDPNCCWEQTGGSTWEGKCIEC